MKDPINPNHYKNGKVEAIDAIEAAVVNKKPTEAVCVGNVIKYLWRYEEKNGLTDVKKAKWYLERLISQMEENESKEVGASVASLTDYELKSKLPLPKFTHE